MPYLLPILLALTVLAFLLYLREKTLKPKSLDQPDLGQKGFEQLHSAIKKAQAILAQAELEGIKIISQSKLSSGKLDEKYSDIIKNEASLAEKQLLLAEQTYVKFLEDLKALSEKRETDTMELTRQNINQVFGKLEERLSAFLVTTEQKTTSSIELELKSARSLIESYKTQQLQLIDENIVAIMERTLSLVLNKKLSLKDQLDLIYEALEKAKVEKFII